MAGKITRLNDPANPYSQKPTKLTAERSAASAREMKAKAPADTGYSHRAPNPNPVSSAGKNIVQRLNDSHGGGARKRAIDSLIDKASK